MSMKACCKEGILAALRNVDLHGEPKVRCQKRQRAALDGGMGNALLAEGGGGSGIEGSMGTLCGWREVGMVHRSDMRGSRRRRVPSWGVDGDGGAVFVDDCEVVVT